MIRKMKKIDNLRYNFTTKKSAAKHINFGRKFMANHQLELFDPFQSLQGILFFEVFFCDVIFQIGMKIFLCNLIIFFLVGLFLNFWDSNFFIEKGIFLYLSNK